MKKKHNTQSWGIYKMLRLFSSTLKPPRALSSELFNLARTEEEEGETAGERGVLVVSDVAHSLEI